MISAFFHVETSIFASFLALHQICGRCCRPVRCASALPVMTLPASPHPLCKMSELTMVKTRIQPLQHMAALFAVLYASDSCF